MPNNPWIVLIISLPGKSGTVRMRVWRALKAGGAGILRDGVYLLPASVEARALFDAQCADVRAGGGTAYVLELDPESLGPREDLLSLFDRQDDYEDWAATATRLASALPTIEEPEARRDEAALRRRFDALTSIDFFPGAANARARARLEALSDEINRTFSPGEPRSASGRPERRQHNEFQNRVWATRQSLWVDRVASAWLIQRFVDPGATFVWLRDPARCPAEAVGFDFDHATFTHIGDYVTFEVLLYAFELEGDQALSRIGALVHYLDVGGSPVADAAGFVAMLSGLKQSCRDDDTFLAGAAPLLDHLYTAYQQDADVSASTT